MCEPDRMPSARLIRVAAMVLLVVGFVLPCAPLADYSGYSMPAQDPTLDMLAQQALDVAVAEHRLAVAAAISGALILAGVAGLVAAKKQAARERAAPRG
jgi:hypothetical protein